MNLCPVSFVPCFAVLVVATSNGLKIDKSIRVSTPLDLHNSTYPALQLSTYPAICICLSVYLSICLSASICVYLRLSASICPCVRLSVRPSVYLSLLLSLSLSLSLALFLSHHAIFLCWISRTARSPTNLSFFFLRGLAASRSILLRPCRHVCCCSACAENLDRCPVCREPAELKENVYVP